MNARHKLFRTEFDKKPNAKIEERFALHFQHSSIVPATTRKAQIARSLILEPAFRAKPVASTTQSEPQNSQKSPCIRFL